MKRKNRASPDNQGGALARIRGILPSLLPAERKVADYVLASAEKILDQSVGEIAANAGVSEATIIRFCRTAGFTGYQNLKISLARELVNPLASTLHENISEKDDPATIARKVFAANIDTLNDTLSLIDPKAVEKAVKLLSDAHRILVIGVGTSAPIAFDAYAKLMRLGAPVILQTDGHLQMMEAALLTKKDVILAISHSGSTIDPVETVKVGKSAGARIVCVTNNAMSPLAKAADVILLTASKETKFRSEALASRIAQSSIIDLLYITIGLKKKKRALTSAEKIENVITSKQY